MEGLSWCSICHVFVASWWHFRTEWNGQVRMVQRKERAIIMEVFQWLTSSNSSRWRSRCVGDLGQRYGRDKVHHIVIVIVITNGVVIACPCCWCSLGWGGTSDRTRGVGSSPLRRSRWVCRRHRRRAARRARRGRGQSSFPQWLLRSTAAWLGRRSSHWWQRCCS